jgi:hypothetical protein
MQAHWARYDFMKAQRVFGLKHAETIVTLSGAHTVGHSQVHKESPTSLGTFLHCAYTVICCATMTNCAAVKRSSLHELARSVIDVLQT